MVKVKKFAFFPKLLKVFSKGRVTLFGDIGTTWGDGADIFQSTVNLNVLHNNPKRNISSTNHSALPKKVLFYVKRENEEYPTLLAGRLANWKKRAKEYFHDCDAIGVRIEDGRYKLNNLVEMVDVYNDFCFD